MTVEDRVSVFWSRNNMECPDWISFCYHVCFFWCYIGNPRARAPHELTRRLIQIWPVGISLSKLLIRIRMGKFPRVTCLNRSGTCRTTDHPVLQTFNTTKKLFIYILIIHSTTIVFNKDTYPLLWALIGPCWPAMAFVGPALTCIDLHWPAVAFVGHHWPSLAFIGRHWPLLAFVGLCGPAFAIVHSLGILGHHIFIVNNISS